jgi:hypothetical protein
MFSATFRLASVSSLLAAAAALTMLFAVAPETAFAQEQNGGANVGVGLGSPVHGQAFVNVVESMREFKAADGGTLPEDELDSEGWPTADARAVPFDVGFWDQDDPEHYTQDLSGTYRASMQGTFGSADVFRGSISNKNYDASTNTTTFDVDFDGAYTGKDGKQRAYLAITFEGTERTPGDGSDDPGFTDLRILRPGYDLSTNQKYTDVWKSLQGPFGTLRYMDWLETNGRSRCVHPDTGNRRNCYIKPGPNNDFTFTSQPVTVSWDQRPRPSESLAMQHHRDGYEQGTAWLEVIQLANRTGTDPWINVPIHADDDYITQLAQLFAEELDAGLTVYVEYANEVWNFGFGQTHWNRKKALDELQSGDPHNYDFEGKAYGSDGQPNPGYVRNLRFARRTADISEAFRQAFSDDRRVRPVLSWMINPGSFTDNYRTMLRYVDQEYGTPSDYFWGLSGTGYYGIAALVENNSIPEGISEERILDVMEDDLPGYYGTIEGIADDYGLESTVYEGGDNTSQGGSGYTGSIFNRVRAARSERMADLIDKNLTRFSKSGGALYMYFTVNSDYNRFGTWGATDDPTRPNRDHQYGALTSFINSDAPAEAPQIDQVVAQPTHGVAPQTVGFEVQTTADPDVTIDSYRWAFGNGSTGSGSTDTTTYRNAGEYTAVVEVIAESGSVARDSVLVNTFGRGNPGEVLVYDGLAAGNGSEAAPLDGVATGAGWRGPWAVQNGNTDVPGFNVSSGGSMSYGDLETSGTHAVGGKAYLTAVRRLDKSSDGPLGRYLDPGGKVGKIGTTLWMSALLRNDADNYNKLCLSSSFRPRDCRNEQVGVGYYGSDASGGEWSLRANGDSVVTSGTAMTEGEPVFVIVRMAFKEGETDLSLFVDPPLQTAPPDEGPDAQMTYDERLDFSNLGWKPGNRPDEGALDEFRLAQTYGAAATKPAVLPVELAAFEAQWNGGEAVLSWKTASETNNRGFHVQRRAEAAGASGEAGPSSPPHAWEQVGFRKSKAAGGTSTEAIPYQFTDEDVPYDAEALTYRLVQKDRDGTQTKHAPVTVEVGAPSEFALEAPYPHPVHSGQVATLRYRLAEKATVTLEVYDALGRRVRTLARGETQAARGHERSFAAGALSSGVYFVRLTAEKQSGGTATKTQKVVVVR